MADGAKRVGRKLLVASLGVATMTYGGGCGTSSSKSDAAVDAAPGKDGAVDGRTAAPDAHDAGIDRHIIANLVAY